MRILRHTTFFVSLFVVASCADFDSFHVRQDATIDAEAGSSDGDSGDDAASADANVDADVADAALTDGDVADGDATMPAEAGTGCAVGQCTSLQYCGPGGVCLDQKPNREDCSDATQCLSGFCDPDGVCCTQGKDCCHQDSECSGSYRCDVAARECFDTCSTGNETTACKSEGYCSAGSHCVPDLVSGAPGNQCTRNAMCAGNVNCLNGYCCSGACTGCKACNVAGSLGVCANVPIDTDTNAFCAASGCTNTGNCNGAGQCQVPALGADPNGACNVTACSNNGSCNGTGQCSPVAAGDDPLDFCLGGTFTCNSGTCNGSGSCGSKVNGSTCGTGNCGPPRCSAGTCLPACEYSGESACGYCSGDDAYQCGGC